jgi:hypothetical protein
MQTDDFQQRHKKDGTFEVKGGEGKSLQQMMLKTVKMNQRLVCKT